MTIPFTYRVLHIPSGKWYYGVRYAENCHPTDLWSTYFTSSDVIKSLIQTDGHDAFKPEIRRTFASSQQAIRWELKVLRRVINFDTCLNKRAFPAVSDIARLQAHHTKSKIQENGLTGYQQAGLKWQQKKYLIDETSGLTYAVIRKNKYNATMIKLGHRDRLREISRNRLKVNNPAKRDSVKSKISSTLKQKHANGELKSTKGQKFQSISTKLIGNQNVTGTIWVTNGITDIRVDLDQIPIGFVKGRTIVNNKGHKYRLLTCPICGKTGSGGNMKRYHFDNCKSDLN